MDSYNAGANRLLPPPIMYITSIPQTPHQITTSNFGHDNIVMYPSLLPKLNEVLIQSQQETKARSPLLHLHRNE